MSFPIVFIHYGDAEYLKYTLAAAMRFNPEKKIFLLGDSENEHYKRIGINHIHFKQFHYGQAILEFEQRFSVIKGEKFSFDKYKGSDYWIRFVFLRWFYINNFVLKDSIDSFWTFDSDTLIVSELSQFEKKFSGYDCTEQCSGACMNGFISNVKIVDRYVKHINDLFVNEEYLARQKNEFETDKGFAFTEMRAYLSFKEKYGIKTFHLSSINQNGMFDDCLCIADGMEQIELPDGNKFKKLYQETTSKSLFVRKANEKEYVQLHTLNLSWLPTYIIRKIYYEALKTDEEKHKHLSAYIFKTLNFQPRNIDLGMNKVRGLIKGFIKKISNR